MRSLRVWIFLWLSDFRRLYEGIGSYSNCISCMNWILS